MRTDGSALETNCLMNTEVIIMLSASVSAITLRTYITHMTMSISASPNSSLEAWSALKGTGRPMLARCVAPKSSADMIAKFWQPAMALVTAFSPSFREISNSCSSISPSPSTSKREITRSNCTPACSKATRLAGDSNRLAAQSGFLCSGYPQGGRWGIYAVAPGGSRDGTRLTCEPTLEPSEVDHLAGERLDTSL